MGVWGVARRRQARRKVSFCRGAKLIAQLSQAASPCVARLAPCRPMSSYDRGKLFRRGGMSGTFEQARDFFMEGVAHFQAGRLAEADRSFAASLALVPGRASTLTNLGAVRLKLGKVQEAADLLEEALKQEPDNAEALGHRATALAELGRHKDALACADRALSLNSALGPVWSLRGELLKDLGRDDEAAAAFENA